MSPITRFAAATVPTYGTLPPEAPQMSQIRLIDYDFAKYGASAERRRLIERWDREVNTLPR